MNDIERLFGGNDTVPGLRAEARARPSLGIPDTDPEAKSGDPSESPVEDISVDDAHSGPASFPLALLEPLCPSRSLTAIADPAHPFNDRIRQLRTELMLRRKAHSVALGVAVIGCGAGEGRSQIAAELAIAFAQLGRSTLLLDADMRNPRQHLLFGTELRDGLAQAIERSDAPTLFGVDGYPTLSVLTAGICPANPIEFLSDGRFESLFDEFRHYFEFIVVDTPRFADYADAQVISTVVGNVLTVHRARHSSYKAARTMLRQLDSTRANILGGVLQHF